MLNLFTKKRKRVKNNKGFSLVEVLVAIFIAAIIITTTVETFRVIFKSIETSRYVNEVLTSVEYIYDAISLGDIKLNGSTFYTNIGSVSIFVKLTNTVSTNPLETDILIYATNFKYSFSVMTSIF
jgi:prepilin-type N-terminal cleavage/methylation domain-containing protein